MKLNSLCLSIVALSAFTCANAALASTRVIFVPAPDGAKAILMLEAYSALGGSSGQVDPDPQDLYNKMAAADQNIPGNDGEGKLAKANEDKSFSLTCAHRGVVKDNFICTFVSVQTSRANVDTHNQRVDTQITGADAAELNLKLAGPHPTNPFIWTSRDQMLHIESTADHFWFKYGH